MISWIKSNLQIILIFILSVIIVFCLHTAIGYSIDISSVDGVIVAVIAYSLCVPVAFVALISIVATIRE